MSIEPDAVSAAVVTSDTKTNLCICSPPFGSSGPVTQMVQQNDVQQPQELVCSPCQRTAGAPVRPASLFNTKCFYYTQPGGCQRDDCRFLHDEEPQNVVFYDAATPNPWTPPEVCPYDATPWTPVGGFFLPIGAPPTVKVEDVRVFFGNVPQSEPATRIRQLVEPLGEVLLVDIQPTKLHNRRCSGFIHMTSLAAAEAAVEKINSTVIGRANLYANIKSHKVFYKPLPGWDPSLMYIDPPEAGADTSTVAELQIGVLPPLLEVEEEEYAAKVSPVCVVTADISAVSEFGLK